MSVNFFVLRENHNQQKKSAVKNNEPDSDGSNHDHGKPRTGILSSEI
jgi:hypothetical protein